MKIKFKEFKIFEYKLKKYGHYTFSDGINVLRNSIEADRRKQNKVGKSSILKSMMYCLGLEVKNWDPKYIYKDMIFELLIETTEEKYIITRYRDKFSLNNNEFISLGDFREAFANILEFDLKVEYKKANKKILPYPEDYLMFYYVDQDASWSNKLFLNVNPGIAKYVKDAHKHIYNYLIGISDENIIQLKDDIFYIKEEKKVVEQSLDKIKYVENEMSEATYKNVVSINEEEFQEDLLNLESIFKDIFLAENELKKKLYDNAKKINKFNQEIDELGFLFKDISQIENGLKKSKCKLCESELTADIIVRKYQIAAEQIEIANLHKDLLNKLKKAEEDRIGIIKESGKVKEQLEKLKVEIEKKVDMKKVSDYIDMKVEQKKTTDFGKIKKDKMGLLTKCIKKEEEKKKELRKAEKKLKERKEEISLDFKDYLSKLDLKIKGDASLKDYSKILQFNIKDTGTSKNIIYLALFLTYFKLIDVYSNIKLPFVIDTVIKDDHDDINLESMSAMISEDYFELNNQVFYSYVENEKFKLTADKINYINIDKRICNLDFTKNEDSIITKISQNLVGFNK